MTPHLFKRLMYAKKVLKPVQSKYRVIYEHPDKPDETAYVLIPDPNFMAAALAGWVLPPIDTYQRDRLVPDGEPKEHPYADPIPPMTEEETIEYLIMKDLDPSIWRDYKGNRVIMKIVPKEKIPLDRSLRNAWRVAQ